MGSQEIKNKAFQIEELTTGHNASVLSEARELLLEYGRFVISQPGVARFCFGTLEKEAAGLPLGYIEQGGGSLMASVDGKAAGFVAWRAVPEAVASESW